MISIVKPGSVSERCGTLKLNKVSSKVRKELLDQHNKLRRKIAQGLQADQPPAADMRELVRISLILSLPNNKWYLKIGMKNWLP